MLVRTGVSLHPCSGGEAELPSDWNKGVWDSKGGTRDWRLEQSQASERFQKAGERAGQCGGCAW